ncbi:hypothetical protein GOBAR_AA21188 [Gossypium barbadense]|uniref:Uncharacterized protein n=5 Tax=Gossypium TaxID=3633 RepID=A0A2P5X800_GOSBA|nr:hypothetical protein GOBAR_AA21188 [Gossypium barbadense]
MRKAKADIWYRGVFLLFQDDNFVAMYKKIYRGDFKILPWFSPEARRLITKAEKGESSSAQGKKLSSMAETWESSAAKGKEPYSMAETGESSSAKGKEPSSMAETGESSSTKGKESSSMAETGEPSAAAREVRELKKELQMVVTMILEDEDDNGIDILSESIRILSRLREMKLNRSAIIGMDTKIQSVLNELINNTVSSPPLIMGDPFVSVSTEALDWMKSNEAELKSQEMMEKSRDLVNMLLHKLYCSFSDAKEAAQELKMVTKSQPACRAVFAEIPDSIKRLLGPISVTVYRSKFQLQEDLIKTVLNISTDDINKQHMGEHPIVIHVLTRALYYGTTETKRSAAMALVSLLSLESNKFIIGKSMAPTALLQLVRVGDPLAKIDAASAILSLCTVYQNIAEFNKLGAVQIVLRKIGRGVLVDRLLRILAVLSSRQDTVFRDEEVDAFRRLIEHRRHTSSRHAEDICSAAMWFFTRR